ncbi:hypothetical protein Vretifemale_3984, partial [Volvox reticuliferus]
AEPGGRTVSRQAAKSAERIAAAEVTADVKGRGVQHLTDTGVAAPPSGPSEPRAAVLKVAAPKTCAFNNAEGLHRVDLSGDASRMTPFAAASAATGPGAATAGRKTRRNRNRRTAEATISVLAADSAPDAAAAARAATAAVAGGAIEPVQNLDLGVSDGAGTDLVPLPAALDAGSADTGKQMSRGTTRPTPQDAAELFPAADAAMLESGRPDGSGAGSKPFHAPGDSAMRVPGNGGPDTCSDVPAEAGGEVMVEMGEVGGANIDGAVTSSSTIHSLEQDLMLAALRRRDVDEASERLAEGLAAIVNDLARRK